MSLFSKRNQEVLKAPLNLGNPIVSQVLGICSALAVTWPSFLDGIGNGLGYAWILVVVGFIREVLGSASILGHKIPLLNQSDFFHNGMMTMPAMALIICGCVVWAHRSINDRKKSK